jgi:hypothetical protein
MAALITDAVAKAILAVEEHRQRGELQIEISRLIWSAFEVELVKVFWPWGVAWAEGEAPWPR